MVSVYVPSSAVSTPFTRIGNWVIVWSHFTSCPNKWEASIKDYKFLIFCEILYINSHLTFQLRERSICPATYEASPESLVCRLTPCMIIEEKNIYINNYMENYLLDIKKSSWWPTLSIFPRFNPSKFFRVKNGGRTNL